MPRLVRRLIYIFFVILFLASVPTVLLYTAGYRYNFKKWKLMRTGVLFLESIPRGAEIFLNNKKVRPSTPARLPALLPEDYQIQIQKSGHFSWQKTLPVLEGQTTFANTIFLPKDFSSENIFEGDIRVLNLSPSGKIMFLVRSDESASARRPNYFELGFYNLQDRKYQTALTLPKYKILPDTRWLDDKNIVVNSKASSELFLLNTDTPSPIFLNEEFGPSIRKIELDVTQDGVILVQTDRELLRFNIQNRQKELIEKYNFDAYQIQGGLIYFTQQYLKNLYLANRPITDKSETAIKNLLQLKRKKYEFLDSPDGFILLRSGENITLIKLTPEPRIILGVEAREARYFKNKNSLRLLYFTDFEIFTLELGPETGNLVTRIGTKIEKVKPLSDGEHLLILSDNKIIMVELDNRDGRNVWILANGEKISDFTYDRGEEIIYFVGQIFGQKNGLYRRPLK